MRKTKKMMAVALSATMVLASSLTAFAEEPVKTGNTEGAGTSEGHVEKELLNVVLPTIAEGATPFSYTMDPERLVQATNKAAHEGKTFPDKDSDKGVYFLAAADTYANTSETLTVTNKSSCAIDLTVKVQAVASAGGKDIGLATDDETLTDGDKPLLYLGLNVGDETTVVSGTEQTVTNKIEGVAENFEVAVDDGGDYVYQQKSGAADNSWKKIDLNMEGAVGELPITSETTAPTVKVTWSWDKAATDAAPSIATTSYTLVADTPVAINVNLGAGNLAATSVTALKSGTQALPSDAWSYSNGVLTITAARVNTLVNAKVTRTYTVVFNDEAKTTVDITLNGSGE
ncbi:hypothetical protein [Butyrivibrio sp. LB2008]|jgi:hypothetical protein|uniref:hypothetical protein n=1 Tax=Butyrivibrio sp. LB2008 TaxID=1408305 RepID=UPI00047D81A2|nr:hypothetical protein [Butyrivibrio sp. LB2008]